MMTARRMQFSNWRTLPGQELRFKARMASWSNARSGLADLRGKSVEEKLRQQPDVVLAVAQRRQRHLHHGQPVKQILAESAGRHRLFQIGVGGGDDAGVDGDGLPSADALDGLLLEESAEA